MTISANTILRSRNAAAPEHIVSTFVLRYPRPIHAEFMTHRVFSRNAASSRAIPVEKLVQDVLDDPFVPLHWGKNQKGMQAGEEMDDPVLWEHPLGEADFGRVEVDRREAWLHLRDQAVKGAEAFAAAGYHKQIVNRLLEPFAHITVVVTSTEWNNFLALRDHPDAEPHIQVLARKLRSELKRDDNIQLLWPGQWHLPFVGDYGLKRGQPPTLPAIKKSVACCASTSYKTVEGFDMTMERAEALHDKLVGSEPLHASPCEHVCQVDQLTSWQTWANPREHANFKGFRQYRRMLELKTFTVN